MAKNNVTKAQLIDWLGSDSTQETLTDLLLQVANGSYTADELKADIINYSDEDFDEFD